MRKRARLEGFARRLAQRKGWKWGLGCCSRAPGEFVSTRGRVLGERLILVSSKDAYAWTHCGSYDLGEEVFYLLAKDVNIGQAFDTLKERILSGSQRPYTSGRGLLDGVRKWGGPLEEDSIFAVCAAAVVVILLVTLGKLLLL